MNKTERALEAAVTAIYFDDSSDYKPALWRVVQALDPKIAKLLESDAHLAYGELQMHIRRALSQSEAPAEKPEDERLSLAVIEHLGPTTLANGKMSVLDAFTLGWQAAKRDALTQERAAVTDDDLIESMAVVLWHRFAPDHHIEWADETNKSEYLEIASALLSLAQSKDQP